MAVSLVFVVCFVSSVVSQAPGDGDSLCVDEFVNGSRNPYFDLRPTYPANVRPLMDSRDYVGLLQGSDNLPWQQVDNDDNNTAQVATEWSQPIFNPCEGTVTVCGFSEGAQENWLITQHISRELEDGQWLQKVTAQFQFTLNGCDVSRQCRQSFVVYKWQTSTIDREAARNTDNYDRVGLISTEITDGNVRATESLTIELSAERGFYLAVVDLGTCISIHRILVFYYVCTAEISELIIRPAAIHVPDNSESALVNGECVENSSPQSGLNPVLRCGDKGQWQVVIPCHCNPGYELDDLFQCSADCGSPPAVSNASVATPNGTLEGSTATYTCDSGFGLVSGDATLTCVNGTWTGTPPTCAADCGSPPAVSYATVATPNGTLDGSTATYTCDSGFGLASGDTTLTCVNGMWTGTQPTCTADCGSPPAVSDATVDTPGGTLEGSTATYTCASGFVRSSGDATLTCVNGVWTGTPPTCAVFVQEAPQPQGVLLGGPATMTCVIAAGFNITTIQWSRDGTAISDNDRITTTLTQPSDGVGNYSSQLTIDPVLFDDCGVYTCSAIGVSSPTVNSSAAALGVVDLNSTSDPNPVSSVGAIGQLSCTILSCGEPFSIEWDVFKDIMTADIMPAESSSVVDNLTRLMSVVTINTLGLRNNGERQHCRVTYGGEDVTSQVFNYTLQNVEVSLTVYPERSGSFIEGENITLTCDATNPPSVSASLTFVWGRSTNGEGMQPLMTNERFTITHGADYSILRLMNIQDDSVNVEGTYLCRVYNRLIDDSVTKMIDIDVVSGPEVDFPSMRGGSRVTVGYDLTVTCDTGRSNPRVSRVVISSGGVVLASTDGSSTSITITNPTLENNGTVYVCTAVNAIGNTSRNFSLIVQDRPAMVDITTLTSTLLSLLVATVSWTPPADNNSPITLYTISVCTLTSSICSNVENFTSLVPYLLLEVVPTYQYNVTVTAANDINYSDTSDVGMVFGAVNGDSLVSLHTSLVTDTLVILEWTLPPLATTPDMIPRPESTFTVTEYRLSMNMEPDTFVSLDHDITSHLFNNLNDRKTIMFTVTVIYSDSRINDNLQRITVLPVTIPSRGAVPPLAMAPAAPVVPTSSGFTISWNVPEVNTDFLTGYEITIKKVAPRRRKRLADVHNVDSSQTNFPFIDGKPFTNYITSVDGLLSVNEVPGRVAALVATPVRTAEAASSPPVNLQQADIGITSVTVQWDLPLEPNGIISGYQVTVASSTDSSPLSVPGLNATVKGLRGNTDYSVTVRAVNGAGDGELSQPLSITTNLGVYPPEIASVTANENTGQYILRINRFKTDFGDISHYFIYVVETDSSPDTSTITDTDLQGAYIAVAADVPTSTSSFTVVIGTGDTIKYNNRDYTNRAVMRGTSYYFFVRLYSGVDPSVFNDSTPVLPATILLPPPASPVPTPPPASPVPTPPPASPVPTEDESVDTVAIVAGVLGSFASVITVAFIALLIFILIRGRRVQKHTFPQPYELEDEIKVGVELQTTGRPTESSKTAEGVAVSENEEMDANGRQEHFSGN